MYLSGRPFTLVTDHRPLEKLSTIHKKTLNRLQQQMLEFDFDICYKEGTANTVVHTLSSNTVAALSENSGSIKDTQHEDSLCGGVCKFLQLGCIPRAS